MRTLKLTLAYDGTRFVGWQRQAEGASIQGLLEAALGRFEAAPVIVHGAGRTDAGVHALGQVASATVNCRHDVATLRAGLNAHLPEDVRVIRVEEAATGFHARFQARSKTYRYVVRNAAIGNPFDRAYAWQVSEPLDLTAMRRAAHVLVGTHDFAAFRSTGSEMASGVRTMIRSEVLVFPAGRTMPEHDDGLIAYEITGDGFLRHMVRAIVGTLVEVGRGRRRPETITELLSDGVRAEAGATAPPHGLFLVGVVYD